ncbi:unnamed protein product [Protopolystoma xenopodis]|uniref:Uncharacterized protein n=1 Tax=Protopolystoma xenopodis TaxID=117903 RepID=A0A448WBF0_9PLAT|nr:unnamed protein product [Protopolystoma xenopodis]
MKLRLDQCRITLTYCIARGCHMRVDNTENHSSQVAVFRPVRVLFHRSNISCYSGYDLYDGIALLCRACKSIMRISQYSRPTGKRLLRFWPCRLDVHSIYA